MTVTGRRTLGIFSIITIIVGWTLLVASFADGIARWPIWGQSLFYLVAGLAWLLPMKPLLVWMNKDQNQ